jgi:hypothetical protein
LGQRSHSPENCKSRFTIELEYFVCAGSAGVVQARGFILEVVVALILLVELVCLFLGKVT